MAKLMKNIKERGVADVVAVAFFLICSLYLSITLGVEELMSTEGLLGAAFAASAGIALSIYLVYLAQKDNKVQSLVGNLGFIVLVFSATFASLDQGYSVLTYVGFLLLHGSYLWIVRKSPWADVALILSNIASIFIVALFHLEHLSPSWEYIGYPLLLGSLIGIVIKKALLLYAYFSRAIVGGLFVVSGLIKANDPLGFAYKLEEYFEDGALAYRIKDLGWETFSLEVFMDYALPIAVFLCVVEVVLGLAVIVGGKIRLTSWSLLLLTVFFGFLTGHTATCDTEDEFTNVTYVEKEASDGEESCQYTNLVARSEADSTITVEEKGETVMLKETERVQCVNDCGCFGDALKGSVGRSLTPWESFAKDAVLFYFILIIFAQRRTIRFNTEDDDKGLMLSSIAVIMFFCWVFDGWWFPLTFAAIMFILILFLKRMRELRIGHEWTIAAVAFICCGAVAWYTLTYIPIKDYRPYAVGNNLIEKMNDGEPGEYESVFLYTNVETGEQIEMNEEELATEWVKTSHKRVVLENDSTGERKEVIVRSRRDSVFDASGSLKDVKLIHELDSVKEAMGPGFEVVEEKKLWESKTTQKTIRQPIPTSIQDFDPFKPYRYVTEQDAQYDSIQKNITAQASTPREEFVVLEVIGYGYNDTVPKTAYQEFRSDYPDSMYNKIDEVVMGGIPSDDAQISFKGYLLGEDAVLLFVMRKLVEDLPDDLACRDDIEYELYGAESEYEALNELASAAKSAGIPVYCLTSSSRDAIEEFKRRVEPSYTFLSMDDIELKIIIRANPGVLLLSDAVVKGKWSDNSIPDIEEVKERLKE